MGVVFSAKQKSEIDFGCDRYLSLGESSENKVRTKVPNQVISIEGDNRELVTLTSPISIRDCKTTLTHVESRFWSRLNSISSSGL